MLIIRIFGRFDSFSADVS